MAAAVKVVVVILLLRMLWAAGVLELNCDAAMLIASERPSNWHLL